MNTAWIEKEICYDGTQLKSHWIYNQAGVLGDCIAGFIGPADVPITNMVDLVDVKNNDPIYSKSMLHFIIEHFDSGLNLAIARQRLLVAIAAEELKSHSTAIVRSGNDLYDGDKKLSVSIATVSPVSTLIHFAINIKSDGTPVPTKGLADYKIEPKSFAKNILTRYSAEIKSMNEARCKVRPVK